MEKNNNNNNNNKYLKGLRAKSLIPREGGWGGAEGTRQVSYTGHIPQVTLTGHCVTDK